MLISYSHKFLFVHVPKTAGTSIVRSLRPYAHDSTGYLVNRALAFCGIHVNLLPGPHRWRRFRPHHSAATIRRHLPRHVYERMYKFAFVRNPWDWFVSYYHFHLQCSTHHRHEHVRRLGSFAEFVRWQVARQRRLQVDFLTDRQGRLLVDFLGRYETLGEDFRTVCRHVGLDCELPWHNRSERGDYRTYYDDATAALVAEHCRADIEAFDYTFAGDESREQSPITLPFPSASASQIAPASRSRKAA
jgi:Sulfotransferase family